MENRLKLYIEYVITQKDNNLTGEERSKLAKDILVNIGFFQHERLVHLLVTILFAFLAMFALWGCLIISTVSFFIFFVLVMILLVPYIRHYYILENGVQKLYKLYDEVVK